MGPRRTYAGLEICVSLADCSFLAIIVDPMRARVYRYNRQGNEIADQRIVLRSSAQNLQDALARLAETPGSLGAVAAAYRSEGARRDMEDLALVLASRLRDMRQQCPSVELAVIVAPEVSEVVRDALHPDLSETVRLFHKIAVGHVSEASISRVVTEWLHRRTNDSDAATE